MSAEHRLRIHNLWAQNKLSKTKSPKLKTHEAFLCLTQSILVTRGQPHIPEICLSTLSGNHTINDFGGNHDPKSTHNTSTLNTGETSSNYSVNLSLSPHKSSHGTFLDSLTIDLFKIPDVTSGWKGDIKPPPSTQFFTKSLACSEISMNFHLA